MLLVPLRFEGSAPFIAALDTATPTTIAQLEGNGQLLRGELRLQDSDFPNTTRFVFYDIAVFDLPVSSAGADGSVTLNGILGADILQHFAVHLSYGSSPSLTLKDEIPDASTDLAGDCSADALLQPGADQTACLAVLGTPRLGGGLTTIGEETLELPATRMTVPLCLSPDVFDPTKLHAGTAEKVTGVSSVGVLSTGLGQSLISRSAVTRLRAAGVQLTESGPITLHLPYGTEQASVIKLERLALVSNETIDLAACGELARRRRILVAGTTGLREDDRDKNGASVALVTKPIELAVLEDSGGLIESLRQELAPVEADVELVLGGDVLGQFELDLDYPGGRTILQCADLSQGTCEVYPFCSASERPRCPGAPTK